MEGLSSAPPIQIGRNEFSYNPCGYTEDRKRPCGNRKTKTEKKRLHKKTRKWGDENSVCLSTTVSVRKGEE